MVDLTYSLGVAAWREQLMCERRSQRSIGRLLDPRSATPQQRERAPGLGPSVSGRFEVGWLAGASRHAYIPYNSDACGKNLSRIPPGLNLSVLRAPAGYCTNVCL